MSDFLDDMGNAQTSTDDRLDQLLTSADAELLTAISTAQASPRPHGSIQVSTRPRWHPYIAASTRVKIAYVEVNDAVVAADKALQNLFDALDSMGLGGTRVVATFMTGTEVVRQALLARQLTKTMADYYLSSGQNCLEFLVQEGVFTSQEVQPWLCRLQEAHRSLLYLVDHSGYHKGCSNLIG